MKNCWGEMFLASKIISLVFNLHPITMTIHSCNHIIISSSSTHNIHRIRISSYDFVEHELLIKPRTLFNFFFLCSQGLNKGNNIIITNFYVEKQFNPYIILNIPYLHISDPHNNNRHPHFVHWQKTQPQFGWIQFYKSFRRLVVFSPTWFYLHHPHPLTFSSPFILMMNM